MAKIHGHTYTLKSSVKPREFLSFVNKPIKNIHPITFMTAQWDVCIVINAMLDDLKFNRSVFE